MILIADSGSSKTDWRLIENETIKQFSGIGLNPDFVDSIKVTSELHMTFEAVQKKEVAEIHFYGSGCSSESRNKVILDGMVDVFPNANINIYHDLLGAARAACGKNRGIAGILGTGSNCCLFDGEQVIQEFRSGGFIIGDEGGGVDIGKRVLKAFIEGRMDGDLERRFLKRYDTNVDEILDALYKKPHPNKYIASFSQFAFHHRENPYVAKLIQDSFRAYFQNMVSRYSEHQSIPLNLVGSIAFYYQETLRKVAGEFKVQIGNIIEKPISGLTLYHTALGAE
jgi:N-acetylglucosamine kinase-like BadF-type ATPase